MAFENLYFIALIPNTDIAGEVTNFKNDFALNYKSSRALKVMPHITLKAPFKLKSAEHVNLLQWFQSIRTDVRSFKVDLEDFGSFANKNNPVIYVRPLLTPSLELLQKTIVTSFENAYPSIPIAYTERKFHPHMTIAYRDLSVIEYERAMDVYSRKKYSASFIANVFYLLQHDSTKWNIISEHPL